MKCIRRWRETGETGLSNGFRPGVFWRVSAQKELEGKKRERKEERKKRKEEKKRRKAKKKRKRERNKKKKKEKRGRVFITFFFDILLCWVSNYKKKRGKRKRKRNREREKEEKKNERKEKLPCITFQVVRVIPSSVSDLTFSKQT